MWELVALGCAVIDFARNNVFLALIHGLCTLGLFSRLRPKRRGVFLFTVLMPCFTVDVWLELKVHMQSVCATIASRLESATD